MGFGKAFSLLYDSQTYFEEWILLDYADVGGVAEKAPTYKKFRGNRGVTSGKQGFIL